MRLLVFPPINSDPIGHPIEQVGETPEEHDISRSDGIGGREQFPNSPLLLLELPDDLQEPSEPFQLPFLHLYLDLRPVD